MALTKSSALILAVAVILAMSGIDAQPRNAGNSGHDDYDKEKPKVAAAVASAPLILPVYAEKPTPQPTPSLAPMAQTLAPEFQAATPTFNFVDKKRYKVYGGDRALYGKARTSRRSLYGGRKHSRKRHAKKHRRSRKKLTKTGTKSESTETGTTKTTTTKTTTNKPKTNKTSTNKPKTNKPKTNKPKRGGTKSKDTPAPSTNSSYTPGPTVEQGSTSLPKSTVVPANGTTTPAPTTGGSSASPTEVPSNSSTPAPTAGTTLAPGQTPGPSTPVNDTASSPTSTVVPGKTNEPEVTLVPTPAPTNGTTSKPTSTESPAPVSIIEEIIYDFPANTQTPLVIPTPKPTTPAPTVVSTSAPIETPVPTDSTPSPTVIETIQPVTTTLPIETVQPVGETVQPVGEAVQPIETIEPVGTPAPTELTTKNPIDSTPSPTIIETIETPAPTNSTTKAPIDSTPAPTRPERQLLICQHGTIDIVNASNALESIYEMCQYSSMCDLTGLDVEFIDYRCVLPKEESSTPAPLMTLVNITNGTNVMSLTPAPTVANVTTVRPMRVLDGKTARPTPPTNGTSDHPRNISTPLPTTKAPIRKTKAPTPSVIMPTDCPEPPKKKTIPTYFPRATKPAKKGQDSPAWYSSIGEGDSPADGPVVKCMETASQGALECPTGYEITSFKTGASFGDSQGSCGDIQQGRCHIDPTPALTQHCLGRHKCDVAATSTIFGKPVCKVVDYVAKDNEEEYRLVVGYVCERSSFGTNATDASLLDTYKALPGASTGAKMNFTTTSTPSSAPIASFSMALGVVTLIAALLL